MPADPIELRIVQSLQAALKGINTSDGYHFTVAGQAVKLDPNHKVEDYIPGADAPFGPPRPFIVLDMAPDVFTYPERSFRVSITMPFRVVVVHDIDLDSDEAKFETHYKLCADVEKSILVDPARGGFAGTTTILNRQMSDPERSRSTVVSIVSGEIPLKRQYGGPNG